MANQTSTYHIANINESRQPEMLRETIPLAVLAALAVIARFVCVRLRAAPLAADDYVIVLALILSYGNFAIVVLDTYVGLGKHTAVEPAIFVKLHYKIAFASSIIYATSTSLNKLSILLFYKRIFPVPKFVLAVRIIAAAVIAWWFAVVMVQIFSCKPVHGFWDTEIHAKCIVAKTFWYATAVPNVLTDVIMLAMVIRMVVRLQMSFDQKLAVVVTFGTGAFVVIAAAYRVSRLGKASRVDSLWTYTDVAIWTSIEPSVGVICACLPTLRPLVRLVTNKAEDLGWKSRSSRGQTQYNPERDRIPLNSITVRHEFHMHVEMEPAE